ncbi:hypothetical protein [Legionella spiritensis]|uniref:hypothetical protein n=1 Tax=Legionella spiritensis TaxID=452 RepID=UPI000F6B6D6F|nr:hypothetical protein [Legionella spiritensis]VEG91120.1 Uncharacterised protein [Legionella spiritensis]
MSAIPEDVHALPDFGRSLAGCSEHWGEEVDLSGEGVIKAHTGDDTWYETAIPNVIGLNGNNPGKGPGVLIQDVEHSGIDLMWTAGLRGCMGLAILGRDRETGRMDAFFSHARHYDAEDATTDATNPMSIARRFVDSHDDVRVFWGTDFIFGDHPSLAQGKRQDAQKILSNKLGCWVRMSDCVPSDQLVFAPKLGIMRYGTPTEAVEWIRTHKPEERSLFSQSKGLDKFTPDPDIAGRLEMQLMKLRAERSATFRHYAHDSRRDHKILALTQILDAYHVGNFDILRYFARSAANNDSPFQDRTADDTWKPFGESVTAALAQEAYQDAFTKIKVMGTHGCGLRANGDDIYDHEEFGRVVAAAETAARDEESDGRGAERHI